MAGQGHNSIILSVGGWVGGSDSNDEGPIKVVREEEIESSRALGT